MPYMKVKMKCKKSSGKSGTHTVYKKKKHGKRGKRVGCTSTPKKYMKALGIHSEQKENDTMEEVFESWREFLKEFQQTDPDRTLELGFDPQTREYIPKIEDRRGKIQYDPQVQGYPVTREQLDQIQQCH